MATIQERVSKNGNVSYRVLVRIKGSPTQTATFPSKTLAKNWAKTTEAAIIEGRHFTKSESTKHTVSEMIDRYLSTIASGRKSINKIRFHLGWWKDQIGFMRLSDVTPAIIAVYRDKLISEPMGRKRKGKSKRQPSTVNRYLQHLSHAFTIALKEWGWVIHNPVVMVTKPKEARGRVRFLSDDERDRLLTECQKSNNPDLYTVVILALSTGARRMEIWGLSWNQVDFKNKRILLTETKNDERRAVPLVGIAYNLLTERAKYQRFDTNLIFPSKINPRKPYDFRRPFEIALEDANISDFSWHDLRHTTASYLAMNGATLPELAEILGHKTLQMVKRYTHLTDSHTTHIVERMTKEMLGG